MTDEMKAAWILPGLLIIYTAIFNFGGFCNMVGDILRICFVPVLIALGIVVAVVAMTRM